ncbi:MAG: hypothetical protein LIP00_00370 [Parabacteroides sp.]|nr:hypothetical protein [Parabacteroides sp.]
MRLKNTAVVLIALTALVSGAGCRLIRAGIVENRIAVVISCSVFAVSFAWLFIVVISRYLKKQTK